MVIRLCKRFFTLSCVAICVAFSIFLLTFVDAYASTVTINDQSGVLDVAKVQTEASKLSVSVLIYTTKTFGGDQDALDSTTRSDLPSQSAIAIGIDTVHRHLSIESGTNVKISSGQASDAVSAFKNNFNGGDYTSATIAAIDSLQSSLTGGNSGLLKGVIVAVLCGVIAVVLIVVVVTRRRTGGPSGGNGRRGWFGGTPYYGGHTTTTTSGGSFGGGAGGSF